MSAVTLSAKGQIVIPAELRARYELTAGTQVELVDDGDSLRLVVRRRVKPTDPAAGYGMIKIPSSKAGKRKLADFDPALLLARKDKKR